MIAELNALESQVELVRALRQRIGSRQFQMLERAEEAAIVRGQHWVSSTLAAVGQDFVQLREADGTELFRAVSLWKSAPASTTFRQNQPKEELDEP